MSLLFPPNPKKGSQILQWAKSVNEYLRSITPRSSSWIQVDRTTGGTTFFPVNRDTFRIERFKVRWESSTSVAVELGQWVRNGQIVNLTLEGGGETYKVVSGLSAADETYYIILTLSSTASKDPALIPDTLSVTASTLEPSESASEGNIKLVIAEVITNSDSEIQAIVPRRECDIDDFSLVPDGESNNAATDPSIKTTNYNSQSNIHEGELQVYNAAETTEQSGVPNSTLRFAHLEKDANGTGSIQWAAFDSDTSGRESGIQKSVQIKSDGTRDIVQLYDFDDAVSAGTLSDTADFVLVRDATGPTLKYLDGADFADTYGDAIGDYLDDAGYIPISEDFQHDALDPTTGTIGDLFGSVGHDYDYWIHGSDYLKCYGDSIGFDSTRNSSLASPTKVIDLTNQELVDSSANITLDWDGRAFDGPDWTFRAGTRLISLDTTVAAAGDGAIDCLGGIYVGQGIYAVKDSANAAGFFTNGTDEVELVGIGSTAEFNDGTNQVWIFDGTHGIRAEGHIRADSGFAFYHGTNAGQSITNWFGGGILIGGSIIEIQASNLQDTDKILVYR